MESKNCRYPRKKIAYNEFLKSLIVLQVNKYIHNSIVHVETFKFVI